MSKAPTPTKEPFAPPSASQTARKGRPESTTEAETTASPAPTGRTVPDDELRETLAKTIYRHAQQGHAPGWEPDTLRWRWIELDAEERAPWFGVADAILAHFQVAPLVPPTP